MGEAKRRKILGLNHSNQYPDSGKRKNKSAETGRMLDGLDIPDINRAEIKYQLSSNFMDDCPELKAVLLLGLDRFEVVPLDEVVASIPFLAHEILRAKPLLNPRKNALVIYVPNESVFLNGSKKEIIFDIQPVTGKEWREGFASRAVYVQDLPEDHPVRIAIYGKK